MKSGRRRGFTIVVLVVAAVAAAACGAGAATTAAPPRPKLVDWCATKADRKAAIRFRATDGARLVGVLLGPRSARAGVVLAHESGDAGLCNWIRYARVLARAGYRVLVFDARGSFSSPPSRAAPYRRDFDVAGATREVRRRGVARVVLVGGSLGAMASVAAAAAVEPPVAGVAAVSPALEFGGLDALAAMPHVRVPLLVVAAEQDREFAQYAQTLHDAAATSEKQLVLFPGTEHGYELVWPRQPGKAAAVVDAFVRARLRG